MSEVRLFSIRRIHDDVVPVNRRALTRVQELMRAQFPGVDPRAIEKLPSTLRDPFSQRLRSVVLIAESHRSVRGFAILMHAPDLAFCFLDFISAAPGESGRGVGGALYERVRHESRVLGAKGLFFECLPDQPEHVSHPSLLAQNVARLRFYENYGARPIANTLYDLPVAPGDTDLPYLVFDDLGTGRPLARNEARAIVRAILERKYGWLCPPAYVDEVVRSFRDNPVELRPARHLRRRARRPVATDLPRDERILLVTSTPHELTYGRDHVHAEALVDVDAVRRELGKLSLFAPSRAKAFADSHLHGVHDLRYVGYLKRICTTLRPGESYYPSVFPERTEVAAPTDLVARAGYYASDALTPLSRSHWLAARQAVDCALTGASALLAGRALAYALARLPGHHASRRSFGGSCYLNSAAVAANQLARHGKVALLDLDYHHGSGHQRIFWERPDVLTVSIHGHPRAAYPYFSGFANERGAGPGLGKNFNFPLPDRVDGALFAKYLGKALAAVRRFEPQFLVVSLGFDTGKGDPTGAWDLDGEAFEHSGESVARLGLPTLFVQEGGYQTRNLTRHVRRFFTGIMRR